MLEFLQPLWDDAQMEHNVDGTYLLQEAELQNTQQQPVRHMQTQSFLSVENPASKEMVDKAFQTNLKVLSFARGTQTLSVIEPDSESKPVDNNKATLKQAQSVENAVQTDIFDFLERWQLKENLDLVREFSTTSDVFKHILDECIKLKLNIECFRNFKGDRTIAVTNSSNFGITKYDVDPVTAIFNENGKGSLQILFKPIQTFTLRPFNQNWKKELSSMLEVLWNENFVFCPGVDTISEATLSNGATQYFEYPFLRRQAKNCKVWYPRDNLGRKVRTVKCVHCARLISRQITPFFHLNVKVDQSSNGSTNQDCTKTATRTNQTQQKLIDLCDSLENNQNSVTNIGLKPANVKHIEAENTTKNSLSESSILSHRPETVEKTIRNCTFKPGNVTHSKGTTENEAEESQDGLFIIDNSLKKDQNDIKNAYTNSATATQFEQYHIRMNENSAKRNFYQLETEKRDLKLKRAKISNSNTESLVSKLKSTERTTNLPVNEVASSNEEQYLRDVAKVTNVTKDSDLKIELANSKSKPIQIINYPESEKNVTNLEPSKATSINDCEIFYFNTKTKSLAPVSNPTQLDLNIPLKNLTLNNVQGLNSQLAKVANIGKNCQIFYLDLANQVLPKISNQTKVDLGSLLKHFTSNNHEMNLKRVNVTDINKASFNSDCIAKNQTSASRSNQIQLDFSLPVSKNPDFVSKDANVIHLKKDCETLKSNDKIKSLASMSDQTQLDLGKPVENLTSINREMRSKCANELNIKESPIDTDSNIKNLSLASISNQSKLVSSTPLNVLTSNSPKNYSKRPKITNLAKYSIAKNPKIANQSQLDFTPSVTDLTSNSQEINTLASISNQNALNFKPPVTMLRSSVTNLKSGNPEMGLKCASITNVDKPLININKHSLASISNQNDLRKPEGNINEALINCSSKVRSLVSLIKPTNTRITHREVSLHCNNKRTVLEDFVSKTSFPPQECSTAGLINKSLIHRAKDGMAKVSNNLVTSQEYILQNFELSKNCISASQNVMDPQKNLISVSQVESRIGKLTDNLEIIPVSLSLNKNYEKLLQQRFNERKYATGSKQSRNTISNFNIPLSIVKSEPMDFMESNLTPYDQVTVNPEPCELFQTISTDLSHIVVVKEEPE